MTERLSERERLINYMKDNPSQFNTAEKVADFILAERDRIVEPLVEYIKHAVDDKDGTIHPDNYNWYIRKAIRNAGGE